ncbi:MAG: DUF1801 domain-containing protein [Pseudomonas sp.]|uniref:DUF1801 domain-containing protein n=1 Tax=Pseudomonas sp. TaxID=306 RepID=UPI0033975A70
MLAAPIETWLADLHLIDPDRHAWVLQVRARVLALGPEVEEQVKYGGLVYSRPLPLCGIFSYGGHVSLEFSQGAALADSHGLLEGQGKGRRHLKLRSAEDIERCRVVAYLAQAFAAAG